MNAKQAILVAVAIAASAACSSSESETASTCERPGYTCDITLAPPTSGLQYKLGPIVVPQGQEALRCFWRKVPADTDIGEIQLAYNHGSHHLDVYTTPYAMPDGDFDCSKPEEWGAWPSEVAKGLDPKADMPRMVVGFQNDAIDWKLPGDVSYKLKAGQQLLIQSHFANVTSQATPTGHMLVLLNFNSCEQRDNHAETLFDEDTDLLIHPHASETVTRICEYPSPVSIIGLFTHFHSRGRKFSVYAYDPETKKQGELLYQNTNWSDPPWYTVSNWGKAVTTKGVKMVAEYQNPEDRDIKWGYFVQENEHMETYVMSYPALDVDPACICHREGEPPAKSCP